MNKIVLALSVVTIIGLGSLISYNQSTKENIVLASGNQSDIPLNYNWVITFDKGLNQDIFNEESIYVLDEEKNKVL
ncbi:hypothetical protein [Psychrobacillus sp.]|uniref:hypothetical protein n=1 Tax=Psychrobacillus sp. TaxID=1871623 RepID=UPI0028BEFA03|nr:hypothetical protein [Psychrobacillus sp.]